MLNRTFSLHPNASGPQGYIYGGGKRNSIVSNPCYESAKSKDNVILRNAKNRCSINHYTPSPSPHKANNGNNCDLKQDKVSRVANANTEVSPRPIKLQKMLSLQTPSIYEEKEEEEMCDAHLLQKSTSTIQTAPGMFVFYIIL